MPTCTDCGQREAFAVAVKAGEERIYDPETGELLDSHHAEVFDARLVACSECGSENIDTAPEP